MSGPLAHNTPEVGPDGLSIPVVIETPTPEHPGDPENWHEASDEEYARFVTYWNHVYDEHGGEPPHLPCCTEAVDS